MPHRVSRFVTCILDQVFPRVGIAMADVLERAGCDVEFREANVPWPAGRRVPDCRIHHRAIRLLLFHDQPPFCGAIPRRSGASSGSTAARPVRLGPCMCRTILHTSGSRLWRAGLSLKWNDRPGLRHMQGRLSVPIRRNLSPTGLPDTIAFVRSRPNFRMARKPGTTRK